MSSQINFYEITLLAVGIPVIVWLTVRAVRRARALKDRIRQVQADLARSPQHPLQAMAELLSTPPQERTHGKRND